MTHNSLSRKVWDENVSASLKKLTKKNRNLVRKYLFQKHDGCCWYCGRELEFGNTKKIVYKANLFVIEHQIPRIRGGADNIENLVAACFTCNRRKGSQTVEEYRQALWLEFIAKPTQLIAQAWKLLKEAGHEDLANMLVAPHHACKERATATAITFFGEQQNKTD